MSDTSVLEKMMNTVIENQSALRGEVKEARDVQNGMSVEIKEINKRLVEIVRIEERQISQKEALSRLGKHVDALDERLTAQEAKVMDLRIVTTRLVVKVTLIAGGSGALVTGILLMVIKFVFANGVGA